MAAAAAETVSPIVEDDMPEVIEESAPTRQGTVVKSDFERPGDDDVLEKVLGDLQAKGVETSEHIVRKHMDELLGVAMQQIHDGE